MWGFLVAGVKNISSEQDSHSSRMNQMENRVDIRYWIPRGGGAIILHENSSENNIYRYEISCPVNILGDDYG